ncbi:hypothetical protein N0V86_001564 [Didymella sp. IMI 355093]|nr:hypothetical protein N0V86_001564 [Didymella sp. IMI 355093]
MARSSSSRCFNDYFSRSSYTISNYARGVIFFAIYLGILITLCVVRKRAGAGKRLIGLPYVGALSFTVIQSAYQFILSTLSACDALGSSGYVYDTNIATLVFSWIQTMLFLYVVFYLLNIMLRKQLGQNLSVLKIVFGIDLLILGVVLLAYTAIICQYYYWSSRNYYYSPGLISSWATISLSLAFDALQILSIIGSAILSVLAVKSLKQKGMAHTSLLVWIAILHFSLLFSAAWSLTSTAGQVSRGLYYGEVGYEVVSWFSSVFYALALVAVIIIARNPVWKSTAFAEEQQYAYHQEPPVYDDAQRA